VSVGVFLQATSPPEGADLSTATNGNRLFHVLSHGMCSTIFLLSFTAHCYQAILATCMPINFSGAISMATQISEAKAKPGDEQKDTNCLKN